MFRESLPEMQMTRPIAPSDRAYRFRVSRIAGGASIFGSDRVVKTLDGVIS